jgi:hypothetical protein
MDEAAAQRKNDVRRMYQPLRPELYQMQPSFLDPRFVVLVEQAKKCCSKSQLVEYGILQEVASDIFVLPMFTVEFCALLLKELSHFGTICGKVKGQPNSMNKHGVLFDEIGMTEGFTNPLVAHLIQPLAAVLFPHDGGGTLDNHRYCTIIGTAQS